MADGDTITVFVDVNKDKREAANVPKGVMDAVSRRRTARAQHDYATADALQKEIKQAGYKFVLTPLSFNQKLCTYAEGAVTSCKAEIYRWLSVVLAGWLMHRTAGFSVWPKSFVCAWSKKLLSPRYQSFFNSIASTMLCKIIMWKFIICICCFVLRQRCGCTGEQPTIWAASQGDL